MSEQKIITGIEVSMQMERAKEILKTQILPKEQLYQKLQADRKLTTEKFNELQINARFDNHRRM